MDDQGRRQRAETRVVIAAQTFVRATRAFVGAHAAFMAGQNDGDLMGADEARSLLDAETSKRCRYCVRAASRHRRAHGRRRVIPLDRVRELLAAYGAAHDEATRGDATSALYGAAPDLARDVLSLAAALATAERERDAALAERDTARSALDGLTAAVRAEREAREGLTLALQDADNDGATPERQRDARVAYCAADRAMRAATEHLDALLSAAPAPAPTTVPAALVRAYLAAEETMRLVAADDHRRDTYHEWAKRHGAAMDAVDAARAALVAGVARCAP